MKCLLSISIISFSLGLSGSALAIDTHTIDRQNSSEFTIQRSIPDRFDEEEVTASACIALPEGITDPSPVSIEGTHQVESAAVSFSADLTSFTNGTTEITTIQAIEGYTWHCYQDALRTYLDTDTAFITFPLSTQSDNVLIFTSIGFVEGISARRSIDDYYYQAVSSHQILESNQSADYFQKLSPDFPAEFNISDTTYEIFQVDTETYFLGYGGQSFSIDENGAFSSYSTPTNARPFYTNNQFVFLISEGIPDVLDTSIQFGNDLNNLSQVYDIKEVGNARSLTYDPRENEYVMLNPGTSNNQDKAYFTSPDLITWTANTVGSYQNFTVVFADDGRSVMKNISTASSLMSRATNGDWIEFASYPSEQYFSTRDIKIINDSFFVLLHEYEIGTGTLLSARIGHSRDLVDWIWTTLTTNTDTIESGSKIIGLENNQIAVLSGSVMYLSNDNGVNWSDAISTISALTLDPSVNTDDLDINIHSLLSDEGNLVGAATLRNDSNTLSDFIFTTTDGSVFNLVHRTNGVDLFTHNQALHFYESNFSQGALFMETAASIPEDDPIEAPADNSDDDFLGSLNWTLLILSFLAVRRKHAWRSTI